MDKESRKKRRLEEDIKRREDIKNNIFQRKINIILYSVIIFMPFIISSYSKYKYVSGKLIFLYIIGFILIYLGVKNKKINNFNSYQKLMILFVFTIFISSIFSSEKYIAFFGIEGRGEGVIMYIIYLILFIFSSKYFKLNKKVINYIFWAACIMSILGIFQFYGFDPIQTILFGKVLKGHSLGFIGHRNFMSTYISLFLFISVGIYIFEGGKNYLIYSNILFFALLCTLTRSGWLAVLIYFILGFVFIIKRRNIYKRIFKLMILFGVIFLFVNFNGNHQVVNKVNETAEVEEESINSTTARVNILKVSLKAFKDRPFIGEGPDTLRVRLLNDYTQDVYDHYMKYDEIIDKTHNEFLEYAVSDGIFTLITYLLLIGAIIIKLFKERKNDRIKILLLTLIGYLAQSFFNISVIMVAPIYWIFLGYCISDNFNGKEIICNNI